MIKDFEITPVYYTCLFEISNILKVGLCSEIKFVLEIKGVFTIAVPWLQIN